MATVSSLPWIPNYWSFVIAPATIRRTLAVATSLRLRPRPRHRHLHKSTRFCCSIWDSNFNSRAYASASTIRQEEYGRLLPCPADNVLPRNIEHLVVKEGGPVLDFITKALDLPPLYVADLIHFGAVYSALVCPKPPSTATPEEIKLYKEFTNPRVLRKRPSIKGKTVREAQNTFRITHIDEFLEVGTYVRVHVRPKRFPRCYEIDWRSRIIAVTESYVVLNKPAGTSAMSRLIPATQEISPDKLSGHNCCVRLAMLLIAALLHCNSDAIADVGLRKNSSGQIAVPVGGTTDNIEETCATFATRALELTTPLKTTHQIDNCTEGCIVLARTKDYCSVFHRKIREKQVKKLYLALAAAYVPCGVMTHYMRPFCRAPKIISDEFIKEWNLCQLEVLECRKVPWPNALIEKKYGIEDFNWPNKEFAYECKINLLTGRTHQIRAQLAACGAPIVGDSMYTPAVIAELASPGLNPFGKYKKQFDRECGIEEWAGKHGKEPGVAIGLQACQISWDEGQHLYEAGAPWWRGN